MNSNRVLKFIHVASTCWFLACSVFLIITALREAGFNWWVIFSLSGHSGTFILFLVVVYCFAVYRGISRSQKIEPEHPLTCSKCYLGFYDVAPFLGGLAGMTMTNTQNIFEMAISTSTGTLISTFLVWIIFDPAVSLAEMALPGSRRHRKERINEMKEIQKRNQEENERLLTELIEKESINRKKREVELKERAVNLAKLVCEHRQGLNVEKKVVELGGDAWRIGGIDCMRQLREMAEQAYVDNYKEEVEGDYIDLWWDGIGSWRKT